MTRGMSDSPKEKTAYLPGDVSPLSLVEGPHIVMGPVAAPSNDNDAKLHAETVAQESVGLH